MTDRLNRNAACGVWREVSNYGLHIHAYRTGGKPKLFAFTAVSSPYVFRFDVPDAPEHDSFCRGEMPAPVYADWLEENGVALPSACYDLLRGWHDEASEGV